MADLFSFSPARRALVTGGASGLGLGAARRLLDVGATVAVADLPAALERMPSADRSSFLAVPINVTDDASVVAAQKAASTQKGIPNMSLKKLPSNTRRTQS